MQIDPAVEWRRLTEHYRSMSDEELRELAQDLVDLTETAQQALRQELRSRGLGEPGATKLEGESTNAAQRTTDSIEERADEVHYDQAGDGLFVGSRIPRLVPEDHETGNEEDGLHEYTWKTVLCECDAGQEAAQLKEALRRAGIESWFNFQGRTTSFVPSTEHRLGIGGVKVLVAADQLEQARAIAEQPIPREIIDESKQEVPDYVEPKCPKCGAEDPVLESVEPTNRWRCEECDAEWSDGTETGDTEAGKADDLPS